MKSIFIVPLIIAILLIVLLVFIPAYLERLSIANRAKRERSIDQLRNLERDARRLERLMAPYLRARSAAYHAIADRANELLADLQANLPHVDAMINHLGCPQVFGYLLPLQHFLSAPRDVTIIISDQRQLNRIEAEFLAAEYTVTEVQKLLDSFAMVPQRLAEEREKWRQRLAELQQTIDRERADGIDALDDFGRDISAARGFLSSTGQGAETGAALGAVDDAAVALESAVQTLTGAEGRAQELQRERAALDHRLRRVATELDNAQVANKAGPAAADLPQIRPLLRRAAALLNESAMDHRRRREFNAAGADVTTAGQLIKIGRDLAQANGLVRQLSERDVEAGSGVAINGLRNELNALLEKLQSEHGDGQSAMADAALASQAAKLRTRAESLVRQQDEIIAGLLREATATRDKLETAWSSGQTMLRLADDEPLARRYSRLLNQFEAARQKPAALEEFRRDVAIFETAWTQWVNRVQTTSILIPRLRSIVPDLIDKALLVAEPWSCLVEDVKFIQQRAADFETTQAKFSTVHHRREAELIIDQLENIDRDISTRFEQLQERATRLQFLEDDVNEIVNLAARDMGEPSVEHPDRPKWDRILRIIDHHLRSAHAAHHYEDASVALLRAADAANKLAL